MTEESQCTSTPATPDVGRRVTLVYPNPSINFPATRVGEVTSVEANGDFRVCCQPTQQVVLVDVDNYIKHGATWRAWCYADGWPMEKKTYKSKK